jgi:hypothetical protein
MQASNTVVTVIYVIAFLEFIDGLFESKWIRCIRLVLLGWITTTLGG